MKKKTKAALTVTQRKVIKHRKILTEGYFVAIDPSCVSVSSVPGYALFHKGSCVEMGVFDIKYHPDLTRRLRAINTVMCENFADIELLVIEEVPKKPLRKSAVGVAFGMNQTAFNSLQRAIGVLMASTPDGGASLHIPASIWHMIARMENWEVNKQDDEDALLIGMTAIHLALKGIDR